MVESQVYICDVCKSREPLPQWIHIDFVYRRGFVESHEHMDYCSSACYITDLRSQIQTAQEIARGEPTYKTGG